MNVWGALRRGLYPCFSSFIHHLDYPSAWSGLCIRVEVHMRVIGGSAEVQHFFSLPVLCQGPRVL